MFTFTSTDAGFSSDEEVEDDDVLYSIRTPPSAGRKIPRNEQKYRETAQPSGQSKSCVMISIKKGRLTFTHPVKVKVECYDFKLASPYS